jgi:ferredoxin-NADP reductase
MTPWRSDSRRVRAAFDSVLRSRLASALAAPRDVDEYLVLFDSTWSVREVRARVTEIRRERGGAVSVLLEPNHNWAGFVAGQYVQLRVERAGVRHTRCFSLSSAPADRGPLRLSIHGLPDGKVSGWAREAARVGEVVALSQAAGDFVLPQRVPARLLLISAGSGVTPIVSIVRQLAHAPHGSHVAWLHYGRRETMLEEEILALGAQHAWLSLSFTRTDGPDAAPAARRRLSESTLAELVPDWKQREAFVCGPAGLLSVAGELWKAHRIESKLRTESFGAAWPTAPVDHIALSSRLSFARSRREARGVAGVSLLEQAEAAGLHPQHGCRMGICHSCRCRKLSGAVRNVRTGVVSDRPDEEIQLCISTPRSDVVLDL